MTMLVRTQIRAAPMNEVQDLSTNTQKLFMLRNLSRALRGVNPLVDRFTVTLVNKGILKGEDFSPEPASGAMYLKPEAMKLYFRHFEHFLLEETLPAADGKSVSFRRCFQLQAQAMAQSLQKGTPYSPFRYGG